MLKVCGEFWEMESDTKLIIYCKCSEVPIYLTHICNIQYYDMSMEVAVMCMLHHTKKVMGLNLLPKWNVSSKHASFLLLLS